MGNLWLKIKIWFKIVLAVLLTLFAIIFIWKNLDETVHIWLWNSYPISLLKLLFFTVIFSVIATILVGTAFRTIRQIRELKTRNQQAQMQKDIEEMKAKADRLQTKPTGEVKESQ